MPGSPAQDRPTRSPAPRPALAAALLAAAALTGCSRDEVTHVQVPKAPAAALPSPASAAAGAGAGSTPPPGMTGDVPPPPSPTGGAALKWTLPKGWTESLSGGMRYATLKAPVPGKLDVSVVVLPGPAGGELANVNRWRGQIGLPPVDEAALASSRKTLRSGAGPVSLFDFTSDGQQKSRMVAGLVEVAGNTWFVKMVGDAEPAAAARPDFLRLVESLRLDSATR
ncbi:MAG TPA: hypothetical protein VFE30_02490 [Anaeromyxobacteraceae bacterium]|jgi:hypothetical protein|nr:hypothetical protein [Anaeromyxobacteraceae bacterium]